MHRALRWLPCVLLLCAPATAAAQDVIKIKLQPAAAPIPALKYRLMPELRELKPGNAVVLYYRAFSPEWQVAIKQPDFWKWVEKWAEDKTKPPPAELDFARYFLALKELDLGARRAHCDWEMIDRLRKDGIMMLLPDIQSFRTYSVLLSARARFEMLDRKYDESLYTLQTGFTLSRHVSEGPTLIQALVGAAMTRQMIDEVEQLIQQPDAPNLYWALTDLPTPFIDLRKPLQGEKLVIDSLFPGWREMLADPQARPMTPVEFNSLVSKNLTYLSATGIRQFASWETRPLMALLAARSYPEARKFLLAQGRPKQLVDQMPVTQVALLYEIYNYDRFFDEMVKWYGQPYPVMRKGEDAAVRRLKEAKADSAAGTFLATMLLPAMQKVFDASYRIDRKLASLRCVEAIRLYAAAHQGKLPASLKDIEEVPVPADPFTGQPFGYTLTATGAVLTAPQLPEHPLYNTWSYEISLPSAPKRSNP
jgi:hypothetical protein